MENFNIRKDLLDLIKTDIEFKENRFNVTKLITTAKATKQKSQNLIHIDSTFTLQCLEKIENDLTREHTALNSPAIVSPDISYESYKYLRDLAHKIKVSYGRERKAQSSVMLPTMKSLGSLVPVSKRKSIIETSTLSFLKLIPCIEIQDETCFKIDLIQCDRL
jgi:hypothetical protein